MKSNNKFEFIIKYLKKENINIDFNEFQFQLETHPDYPSLLSFYDALTFFKIESFVGRIGLEDLVNLPNNFIAELKMEMGNTILTSITYDGEYYNSTIEDNVNKKLSKQEFEKIWTGVVLFIQSEYKLNFVKSNSKQNYWNILFLIVLFCIPFVVVFIENYKLIYFQLLASLGIYFAIEAISEEFNVKTAFSSTFCNLTPKTSCESVIKSNKFKLNKNFGLSDISVIFFISQFFSVFLFSLSGNYNYLITLSTVLLITSIPITIISIFFQGIVQKKWCPICLGIITVLYLELGVLYFFNEGVSSLNFISFPFLIFAISYLIPLLGWVLIKKYFKKYFELKSNRIQLTKFNRNYKLFSYALLNSKKVKYSTLNSKIKLGNPGAKLKISIVTSPFCGHCAKAHELIKEVLDKYSNEVLINIRFNLNPEEKDEKFRNLYFKLIEIYFEKGQTEFQKALDYWFKNKNLNTWFLKFGESNYKFDKDKLLEAQFIQNQKNEIMFTPAIFIGEYLFPNIYERNNMTYFINDLLEDEQFLVFES
jgi:hypothetical protein